MKKHKDNKKTHNATNKNTNVYDQIRKKFKSYRKAQI